MRFFFPKTAAEESLSFFLQLGESDLRVSFPSAPILHLPFFSFPQDQEYSLVVSVYTPRFFPPAFQAPSFDK